MSTATPRIAVLLPCYNEEVAIGQLVTALKQALPRIPIYVYDNNSTDRTSEIAAAAGAIVKFEPQKGKGNVVRRMFADIDADIYLMMDGDMTYDVSRANELIAKLQSETLDMVVGRRITDDPNAYRAGHRWGNNALTGTLKIIFGQRFEDILSGYRVFSRRFVKSFPTLSKGFEIETEMSIHALELGLPVAEVDTDYFARPEGSFSKLNTYRDGIRILWTIMNLFRTEKPLIFFSIVSLILSIFSLAVFFPIWEEFKLTGSVERVPSTILCVGLMISAVFSLFTGFILDSTSRLIKETRRLHYLNMPSPQEK
ncbi:MAG: glycosyl transferase [Alphaproteobacteria bacterium RIFCSPHIGHO2_02_FULL_46_13]|nr:MAG: glycosyl transferase [Alphaproteobacteria bacterium RIFCSPHIGHO2_02_FULL_46_13]